MATSQKTVRFAWPALVTTTTDLVVASLGVQTIYLPELTRTIRSAFVVATGQDVQTAAGTVNRVQVSAVLGAAAQSDVNDTGTLTNTGENIAIHHVVDFTAYFVANFGSGASQTCELKWLQSQSSGVVPGYTNVTAELFITYDYDDTATTQIKTVVIPLESPVGALATTLTQIGTNQIPNLTSSGLLPEASPVIRDWYLLIEGNEANNNVTTSWTLGAQIDSDPEYTFAAQIAALASDRYCRWIYSRKASVPTTTAAHALNMRANAQTRLNHVTITLVVTYEFTPPAAGANRTLNSVLVPITFPQPMGGVTSADPVRLRVKVNIQEPGTITLRQSGVMLFFNAAAAIAGMNARAGSQAFRAYTHNVITSCGGSALQFRIDSGAAGGAALTIARGDNNIDVEVYRTDAVDLGDGLCGWLVLNYESDTSTGGVGRHAHTINLHVQNSALATVAAAMVTTAAHAPVIPETNFSLPASPGALSYVMENLALNAYMLTPEILSGEHDGDGWYRSSVNGARRAPELGTSAIVVALTQFYKRWWADPDSTRAALNGSRRWRLYSLALPNRWAHLSLIFTYHSMYFTVAGTISGSSGGTVTIKAYRTSDGQLVGSTSRSGNGSFTMSVPTDAQTFVEAYESGVLIGRSDNDTPVRAA